MQVSILSVVYKKKCSQVSESDFKSVIHVRTVRSPTNTLRLFTNAVCQRSQAKEQYINEEGHGTKPERQHLFELPAFGGLVVVPLDQEWAMVCFRAAIFTHL